MCQLYTGEARYVICMLMCHLNSSEARIDSHTYVSYLDTGEAGTVVCTHSMYAQLRGS